MNCCLPAVNPARNPLPKYSMRNTLNLPDPALKFVLLQRTALQKLHFRWLTKLGIHYFPRFCNLEARWRRDAITQGFLASLQADFEDIENHLPLDPRRILDIGCGIGGIDVLLNDHYRPNGVHFHLLDKSSLAENVFYDFHDQAAFYNSLNLAHDFLKLNGVAESSVTCQEATSDNRIHFDPGFGLIISLISWGFHYPVTVYLAEVARVLAPTGALILDVRKGTTGLQDLRSCFSDVRVISEKPKFLRLIAKR